MSEVVPGVLFLSSSEEAGDLSFLQARSIRLVVNCTPDLPCAYARPGSPWRAEYHRVPIADTSSEPLLPHVPGASTFIARARPGCAVLVHCAAGVSRSPSVVIASLMVNRFATFFQLNVRLFPLKNRTRPLARRMRLREALGVVERARPEVAPNEGFLRQLVQLDAEMFGEPASMTLEELYVRELRMLEFGEDESRSALRQCENVLDQAMTKLFEDAWKKASAKR
eukprot:m51a1_g9293 putative mitogen-activated protein kinase phosphatase isoform a (225) ;mRNA; f:35135-35809